MSEIAKTADLAPIEDVFICCGWFEIDGKIIYATVTGMDYYKRGNFNFQEKIEIFKSGNSWLDIGHNATVNIIWLIAHSQFLQYFFKRANVWQEFLIFIRGVSGTLKTSTIKTISDPFRNDRELTISKISSSTSKLLYEAKNGEVIPSKNSVLCPNCGKIMIRRKGKKGYFWGCSGYPECKTTATDNKGKPDFSTMRK